MKEDQKTFPHIAVTPEVIDVPGGGFGISIMDVADTTTTFDSPGGKHDSRPVPGMESLLYVPWGVDNQLPYDIARLVGGDEVTSQNKLFNVLTCYGRGLQMLDDGTKQPTADADVLRFMHRQATPSYFLEQATDMKYYYWCVAVVILSRDGRQINRLVHKDACHCRLQLANKKGVIENVFYTDWRDGQPDSVERIPLLDLRDPMGDLMQRMGREPMPDGTTRKSPVKDRKFAILMRFPTVGCQYYPIPYYSAIFRGGSYDEKRLISLGKRAKLKNATSIKYQVEIYRDYYDRILREEGITDPVEAQQRVDREKQNIRDFCMGINNQDKVWISQYYVNPDGKEEHDVVVKRVETEKEGGDWNEDIQAASNTICYGDNVHPNLVGAVPGKSQMNNSGSDKRELFTMKQSLETAFHDILLLPLQMVCEYNGWHCHPTVPIILLTTLDKHKDAEEKDPKNDPS